MKQTFFLLIGGFSLLLLEGCATSHQEKGFTGGYSETQLAPDVFRVNFAGNGYTSSERAQDFALLRAAELSLVHEFLEQDEGAHAARLDSHRWRI